METLRQVWGAVLKMPDLIRAALPWDVGESRWLLWGSVALYVIAALIVCHAFGWLCGWIVGRLVPKP
jgi:hypothetical protein